MKIIHLILGKANPERMNGVNKVVHHLATYQTKAGADVEVWGITPTPELGVTSRAYKVRLFQAHWNKWRLDPELKQALHYLDHDTVFHFHGGFILEFYTISKYLTQLQIPYILTPHGNYMEGAMQKSALVKKWYFKGWESDILKRALFVHCIGEGEIADLRKLGAEARTKLIPNGQDIDSFQYRFQPLGKPSQPIFGFCGRVTRFQKGLDLLLEGFRQYKLEENGKGVLWIVGNGEYKEAIEEFVEKHGIEKHVKLFGSRFGEEKLNIMANMDVFYHPSRNEGLPMAVLEAAVLGKPLVVSEFTNMTYYVTQYEAGICLPENTAEKIAQSMHQMAALHEKGLLSHIGNNARKMAEEKFDWKHVSVQMLEAYASPPSLAVA